ncbi:MAG: chemotaxis protein CheW [Deltaproteobacteria bacterium]|nr:chemotaxis protein CheW [Deltaproteobacteria bacterium]
MKILFWQQGDACYGLDLGSVQEILEAPCQFPIPLAPDWLGTAVNLHNRVVPVADLSFLLGTPAVGDDSRLLVLRTEAGSLALKNIGTLKIAATEEGAEGAAGLLQGVLAVKPLRAAGATVLLLDASGIVAAVAAKLAPGRSRPSRGHRPESRRGWGAGNLIPFPGPEPSNQFPRSVVSPVPEGERP